MFVCNPRQCGSQLFFNSFKVTAEALDYVSAELPGKLQDSAEYPSKVEPINEDKNWRKYQQADISKRICPNTFFVSSNLPWESDEIQNEAHACEDSINS